MRYKNIKAQINSEALIYVLAFFIVSLIIVVGYEYIKTIKKTQDGSSFIIFRNSLRNDIVSIRQDYSTIKIKEYSLPEGVDEICFVDKSKNNPLLCRGCSKSTDYRIIVDRITGNSTRNVFLIDESSIKNTFSLESIKIGCCQFKCFKSRNGKLKIVLEGDGKYALISQK